MTTPNHSRFPFWSYQAEQSYATAVVDGSAVGATASTDGLDARGASFCQISKSGNTYTLTYNETLVAVPIVHITSLTDNGAFNITSRTAEELVWDSVERDDNTAALNDADFMITFILDRSDKAYT